MTTTVEIRLEQIAQAEYVMHAIRDTGAITPLGIHSRDEALATATMFGRGFTFAGGTAQVTESGRQLARMAPDSVMRARSAA